jgi:molybdopterin-guanine dinucleotide biosynthesis protein A
MQNEKREARPCASAPLTGLSLHVLHCMFNSTPDDNQTALIMPGVSLHDVTLAILAGGAGSRMGRPKGMLELHGEPVLIYLLKRLDWPGPTLLVTAPGRERPPGWEGFDREVSDPVADEGPLRGLMTALGHAATETVVVAAVDMPGVTREDLAWLVGELAARGAALAMASRAGRVEPLPCAARRDAEDLVAARLKDGRRSLQGMATEGSAVVVVPADGRDGRAWLNANTPGEWDVIVRSLPE